MRLAEFTVRHPQFTIVLFLMAAALGLNALATIPQAEDPTFSVPTFTVVAVYPGAEPSDMEQLVVDPIEDRLNELDDLKHLRTEIQDGLATITAEFEASADPVKKYDEVVREVNALRPELPAELARLDIQKFEASRVSIVQVALVSDNRPVSELAEQARLLKERLRRVAGVRTVKRWGYPEREVVVELDAGRLARLGIPTGAILQAIGSEDANIPGGSASAGDRTFTVKSSGSYRSVEEIAGTVLFGTGRDAVHVRDVARVFWGVEDARHLARYNRHQAVFVTANMKDGQRIGEVRDAIYRELDRFEHTLPAGITLERGFDQSRNVEARLHRLGEDFAIAILLVLVTLLPLGTRASLVVMISIPLSLAIGVALLQATGFTINQLSIVGFVIALGLLVDDSIVVVENISRFMREGVGRREAAIRATQQITVAVLGCTAALIVAFLPILFLPGNPGKFIRSMPVAVLYTIVASLVVSLTIVPFLASLLLREEPGTEHRGNLFLRGLTWLIDRGYGRWLHRALAAPRLTLAIGGLLVAGSLALIPAIGFSLFPKADTPQFLVRITTPDGSSLRETDRAARFVEDALRQLPGVRSVMMNIGRDNPDVYYNIIPRNERSTAAEAFVLLDRYDPKRTPGQLDSLQQRLDRFPGARLEVTSFENGPPIDAPIAFRLVGEDLDTLRLLADSLTRTIRGTTGTRNVVNPIELKGTGLRVVVDQQKAGVLGVPTVDIDRTVRLALAGLEAGSIRNPNGEDYAIRVRLPRASDPDTPPSLDGAPGPGVLDQLHVTSSSGAQVPLRQVSRVRLEATIPVIQHYNKERSVTVTAGVEPGFSTDRVTKSILRQLAGWQLPTGYRIIPAGEIESREESFGGLGAAIIVAVFLTASILVLEFGSFTSTLIVASVIPLGVVGGLVALFLCGYTLSFTAMIGFVALIGIEIKNSILLVDFTNQLRAEGVPLDQAIEQAGKVRFLPIVLTTMTAVGGLTPLALQGSSLYSPLAMVIIGGLISSTLLARLVTPVMYKLLPPAVEPLESGREAHGTRGTRQARASAVLDGGAGQEQA
jgi:multidrug efflux pump subunit AcrB